MLECTFKRGPPAGVVWFWRRLIKINCFLCRQHSLSLGAGRPQPDHRPGRPGPLLRHLSREVRVETPGLVQKYVTRIHKVTLLHCISVRKKFLSCGFCQSLRHISDLNMIQAHWPDHLRAEVLALDKLAIHHNFWALMSGLMSQHQQVTLSTTQLELNLSTEPPRQQLHGSHQ